MGLLLLHPNLDDDLVFPFGNRQLEGCGHLLHGSASPETTPDGATLWVVDTGAHKISGFTVDGGNLSELPSSPTALPAGSAPFGIVVT